MTRFGVEVRRWCLIAAAVCGAAGVTADRVWPETEQVVEVVIRDFKFVTKQGALRLGLPTVIKVVNEDAERHDFGSSMFEGIPTAVEKDGVTVYGRGIGGMYLDAKRDATIRFNMTRPGRYEFRCSIHPNMKGELLLLTVEAV
jgi:plastocyanin